MGRSGYGLEVGGADEEEEGVDGSEGGEEMETKCITVSQKTVTISSIGSKRKLSIAGSFRGWLAQTF